MEVTFLGTGTSVGVPAVGCDCETCLSDDPRDKRLRTSVLIEHQTRNFLIDASTDFRQQALRTGISSSEQSCSPTHTRTTASGWTMPALMFRHGPIACFATEVTWRGLRRIYSYAFDPAPYPRYPQDHPTSN